MVHVYKTKISKGAQTVVPSAIRRKYGLKKGGYVEWIMDNEKILVSFTKGEVKLKDLIGKIDMGKTNHRQIDDVVNE